MQMALVVITSILTIILVNLLYKLRYLLKWRVNCWFCNNNFWVKFTERNFWTCPQCEQYNGFTEDGDYNKPLTVTNGSELKSPKKIKSHQSPPKNGLCKMCNINQQLKIVQLANFVPINENNFDTEIENFSEQLEQAYRLCTPCRKVLKNKFYQEKETLLDSKLLENRTSKKNGLKKNDKNNTMKYIINSSSIIIAIILLIFCIEEFLDIIFENKDLYKSMKNFAFIFIESLQRLGTIIKMKLFFTFPVLENYCNEFIYEIDFDIISKAYNKISDEVNINCTMQKFLGGLAFFLQIIGTVWNVNGLLPSIFNDLLWTIFVIMCMTYNTTNEHFQYVTIVKIFIIVTILLINKQLTKKHSSNKYFVPVSHKTRKSSNSFMTSAFLDEDTLFDTDDDVSLSRFGINNCSNTSNETISPLSNSGLINGRVFTPQTHNGIWSKPKLNTSFCVNSLSTKSSNDDLNYTKASFKTYQDLARSDSDSDLDESISTLCIGSPKKTKAKCNPIFSIRKFTASPNFIVPTPINRTRPLISPSKLGHNTSWVAEGYWGSECDRQTYAEYSRSSSQSSGFESQASSMNQRNIFPQPPSREESAFREPDKSGTNMNRFQSSSMRNNSYIGTQNSFGAIYSPVFPPMQYNNHVQIPHPRFISHSDIGQNVFAQQQQNIFKAPSRLIKLPQMNTIPSQ